MSTPTAGDGSGLKLRHQLKKQDLGQMFYAKRSATVHTRSAMPAAIAGVTRRVLWIRPKLYQQYQSATAAQWFSHFLLKAFVGA